MKLHKAEDLCKIGPIFPTLRFLYREQTALFNVLNSPQNK